MVRRVEAEGPLDMSRRFTADEYHRMGEAGILDEDDRVELIEGRIVQMPPIGGRHVTRVNWLTWTFSRAVSDRALVSVQNPVVLPADTEPQPDIVVIRLPENERSRDLPTTADVLLIIEVADSSVAYDRDVKMRLYAGAGIPEAWILDLVADRLRLYRHPDGGKYRSVQVLVRGDTVAPLSFPVLELAVDDILG